jgi:acyl-coenzyme A synthetase/AMP-(fatty) acid ligase
MSSRRLRVRSLTTRLWSTWTYAQLAAVVAETTVILQLYDIRPGDRVMIVSENSLALAALILACSEIDVWSVLVSTAVAS